LLIALLFFFPYYPSGDVTVQLDETLTDPRRFYTWLGRYLTAPLRMQARPNEPFFLKGNAESPLADENEELPMALSDRYRVATRRVYDSVSEVIGEVLALEVDLRRAEWIRTAHVDDILFFDGEVS